MRRKGPEDSEGPERFELLTMLLSTTFVNGFSSKLFVFTDPDKGSVASFAVDIAEKLITVTTSLTVEEIHAELKRCGKPVALLSSSKQESFGMIEEQQSQKH